MTEIAELDELERVAEAAKPFSAFSTSAARSRFLDTFTPAVVLSLLQQLRQARPWLMFYRDGKDLGEIADACGVSIYSLSPWLYAPLLRDDRAQSALQASEAARLKAEKERDDLKIALANTDEVGAEVLARAQAAELRASEEQLKEAWEIANAQGKTAAERLLSLQAAEEQRKALVEAVKPFAHAWARSQRMGSALPAGMYPLDSDFRRAAEAYAALWAMTADLPSLQELELYDGVECEGCGEQAVVTDVNGIDLCKDCAEGCRLPEHEA
jgi:hypothetical protein